MASQGPRYATLISEIAENPYDDNAWTNHDNTMANDGVYATILQPTFDTLDYSYLIRSYSFGFSIPTGSTINGIVVEVERRYANGSVKDALVQLTKTDYTVRVGNNKSTGAEWTTSDNIVSFGSSTDLWGATWTVDDINGSNFGVHFVAQANGTDADAYVDFIRITVYYTPATNLVGLDVITGAPVLDKPVFGQTHVLTPTNVTSGAPVPDQPVLGQTHILDGLDVETDYPVLDKPILSQETVHDLIGLDVVAGIPVIDKPIFGQVHFLIPEDLITGIPEVEKPVLGQSHILIGLDIISGAPILDKPVLGQTHILLGLDIVTGAPVLDKPVLGQTHILVGLDIVTGPPVLDKPVLVSGVIDLIGLDVITGNPVLDMPIFWAKLFPTPDFRTYVICEEDRICTINYEDRTIIIGEED